MSDPNDGPVTIFKSNDPGLLAVAQSLLEAADIEFSVIGGVVGGLLPGGAVNPYGVPLIQVPAANADEARELLKELA